jgi:hypothetical protein
MSLTKASYSMISGAKRNVFDFMTQAQRDSVTANDLVEDVTAAIQAAFDSMTPYGNQNNGFFFQEFPVLVFPAGRYKITQELDLTYRNYVTLFGENAWLCWRGDYDSRMIDAQGCNYLNILGNNLYIEGGNTLATFVRVCGADVVPGPAPGSDPNAHGAHFENIFFYSFHLDNTGYAIIDTLNNTKYVGGNYSLDDSAFVRLWFYTGAWAAFWAGSGELVFDNCHFAGQRRGLIGSTGFGVKLFNCIFGSVAYPIYVPINMQADFVELVDCYTENMQTTYDIPNTVGSLLLCESGGNTAMKHFAMRGGLYQHTSLPITANDKFINFGDAAGSFYMESPRFQGSQTPGFIDLGDNAKAIVYKSTILPNYLDHCPYIRGNCTWLGRSNVNGSFAESSSVDSQLIQYIVVDTTAPRDFVDGDPSTGLMTVTSLDRAFELIDQLGITATTIALNSAVSINKPAVVRGRVNIQSFGTSSINFLNTISVVNGGYLRLLGNMNPLSIGVSVLATTINQAISNAGGEVSFVNVINNHARTVAYAVQHQAGQTTLIDCTVTAGGLVNASFANTTGEVTLFGGTYNNTYNVVFLNGSGSCVVYRSNSAPVAGIWSQGSQQLNLTPASGNFIGRVCTTTGAPGTWSTFGAIS